MPVGKGDVWYGIKNTRFDSRIHSTYINVPASGKNTSQCVLGDLGESRIYPLPHASFPIRRPSARHPVYRTYVQAVQTRLEEKLCAVSLRAIVDCKHLPLVFDLACVLGSLHGVC